ncbi:hypothetical protein [Methylobacterium iners]|uniref:Uncharacterized protein n=1 Tax=Methylobacterium iners TaxID=418707 RepID=A0ABQ4RVY5_9HYPH|nr:hypothetical protein [Methylobacterium iners]GJD95016.1 hypothetical protein OCOJLMKI_2225 [Methylobacterium iners]
MTEKKPPHGESMRETQRTHEVDETGAEGHSTRTTKSGAEGKSAEPKVESNHTTEGVDPAEDLGIQNSVA